jgi:hypothetical protein
MQAGQEHYRRYFEDRLREIDGQLAVQLGRQRCSGPHPALHNIRLRSPPRVVRRIHVQQKRAISADQWHRGAIPAGPESVRVDAGAAVAAAHVL